MMERNDIRREVLRQLIKTRFNGVPNQFAAAVKRSPGQISDMLSNPPRKSFGDKVARKFEEALGLNDNYFDCIENADPQTANCYPDQGGHRVSENTGTNEWIAQDENERLILKGWRAASDEMKEGIKALAVVAIKTTEAAA